MDDLCLHCIEDYDANDTEPYGICPKCIAAGHIEIEGKKCELCDKAFFDAIRAISRRIDERVKHAKALCSFCLEETDLTVAHNSNGNQCVTPLNNEAT